MSENGLSIFTALKQKMMWHQSRQGLLAENVANAETPGYRGRDLEAFSFSEMARTAAARGLPTQVTHSGHFAFDGYGAEDFSSRETETFQVTPDGNGVLIEDEIMKVATNQMDYQAATTVYGRSLRLLKTALGR